MSKSELLDYNLWRFVNKTNVMPSSIVLNPRFVIGLINEHRELILSDKINEYMSPIKYRGIIIYESLQLNEGQIEMTLKL
jgi:hypothetical protein